MRVIYNTGMLDGERVIGPLYKILVSCFTALGNTDERVKSENSCFYHRTATHCYYYTP